jgi:hypothetical protein
MAAKVESASPLPPAVLEFLTADERIERCPPDVDYAVSVIDRVLVEEAEDALHAAAQGRWVKANTYSYDGARKSVDVAALRRLARQGGAGCSRGSRGDRRPLARGGRPPRTASREDVRCRSEGAARRRVPVPGGA